MKRWLIIPLMTVVACAQEFPQQLFDRLAPKAADTVEVNLEGGMLALAQKFLSDSKPDEAQAKQLLSKIKSIRVRSLEFEKEGEYSLADVNQLRSQIAGKEWSKVVDARSSRKGGDNAGVYIKSDGNQILGIMVLAAEPKELTLVSIDGSINPEELRKLGGKFGIPDMQLMNKATGSKGGSTKKDEE